MAFLRAAAIAALLQGVGHAVAVVRWAPTHGPGESAVVETMQSHGFIFQGLTRSYWGFFVGYGVFAAFNCLVEAVLFWQLAALATSDALHLRGIVLLFTVANVVYAGLSWKYFFFTPMVFDVAIALCLAAALSASGLRAG